MIRINETIQRAKNEVKELIRLARDKSLEAEPGRTMLESFENRVNQVCTIEVVFILFSFCEGLLL